MALGVTLGGEDDGGIPKAMRLVVVELYMFRT
jgi:hypothetical protein